MPLTASTCASSSKPASIVAGFTPQESSRYEASCLDGKKALVKAKYDEKVGHACEYLNNYVFVVNRADVTYAHEDFDAEGTARVVRTYTSRRRTGPSLPSTTTR
jgi:hypothetical protein